MSSNTSAPSVKKCDYEFWDGWNALIIDLINVVPNLVIDTYQEHNWLCQT